MEREERRRLSEDIEKRMQEKGFVPGKDSSMNESMMKCGLAAFGLEGSYAEEVFLTTVDQLMAERKSADLHNADPEEMKDSAVTLLWMYTADDDRDFDRGPSVDREASEFLFTVLARMSDMLSGSSAPDLTEAALQINAFLTTILGAHWRGSGRLSWWNRFVYESAAMKVIELGKSLHGILSVKDAACDFLKTIEAFGDADGDEDRNCILGMISWYCYEAWHAEEVKDERKERRYLRRTARYLQNIDGNPYENEDVAAGMLEKALKLLEA